MSISFHIHIPLVYHSKWSHHHSAAHLLGPVLWLLLNTGSHTLLNTLLNCLFPVWICVWVNCKTNQEKKIGSKLNIYDKNVCKVHLTLWYIQLFHRTQRKLLLIFMSGDIFHNLKQDKMSLKLLWIKYPRPPWTFLKGTNKIIRKLLWRTYTISSTCALYSTWRSVSSFGNNLSEIMTILQSGFVSLHVIFSFFIHERFYRLGTIIPCWPAVDVCLV